MYVLYSQGAATLARKKGIGAGAITSPAVLAVPQPRLGVQRAVFTAVRRISALNMDFNLPISCYDRFGSSVTTLLPMGDIDHDISTLEIAVGAPGDHTYAKGAGAVYIISLANFGEYRYTYKSWPSISSSP